MTKLWRTIFSAVLVSITLIIPSPAAAHGTIIEVWSEPEVVQACENADYYAEYWEDTISGPPTNTHDVSVTTKFYDTNGNVIATTVFPTIALHSEEQLTWGTFGVIYDHDDIGDAVSVTWFFDLQGGPDKQKTQTFVVGGGSACA